MSAFTLETTDGGARAGVLHTAHGDVATPAFIPVATRGSVKAVDPTDLRSVGAQIVLANTYHLFLRPGTDVVQEMGGLHKFMGWDGPTLTDSGGFQGFSLKHLSKITDDAILFKSHIDGRLHEFSPEASIRYQEQLGADIIMPLDVCPSSDSDREAVEVAVERTSRWASICREAHSRSDQLLFGIVQGGLFPDLRQTSAEQLTSLDFPGYAIGGLSVGESKEEMYSTTDLTVGLLPPAAPRHLMGVGSPEDLAECVALGIDVFDCVLPTRIARNGALFTRDGRINIYTGRFKTLNGPLEEGCDCYTCLTFSAAYVHHLFKARELLAYRLATMHNLRFLLRLMEEMRLTIVEGRFQAYLDEFRRRFVPPDPETRRVQKQKWLQSHANARASRKAG